MKIKIWIDAARTAVRKAREERTARRHLAAELAAFATPQERAELDLIVGRHSLEETRQIREILSRQDAVQQFKALNLVSYRG